MAAISQYQTKTAVNDDDFLIVGKNDITLKIAYENLKLALTDGMLADGDYGAENEGKVFMIDEFGDVTLERIDTDGDD